MFSFDFLARSQSYRDRRLPPVPSGKYSSINILTMNVYECNGNGSVLSTMLVCSELVNVVIFSSCYKAITTC